MDNTRLQRLNSELQKEISLIIANEIRDPRVKGLLTVLRVEATEDLKHAKVYLSIFDAEENKLEVFKTLSRARGFIRSVLSKRLTIRSVPEIHFVLDDSVEYSTKIENILKQIKVVTSDEE